MLSWIHSGSLAATPGYGALQGLPWSEMCIFECRFGLGLGSVLGLLM
jgi:hypothetical protein